MKMKEVWVGASTLIDLFVPLCFYNNVERFLGDSF